MTITAKIIADSISAEGHRITSVQLRYPKFIHGELMTHRVFSRNAASSRAIPVQRMIQDVKDDPAIPVHWGKNQKGMQADEEMSGPQIADLRGVWLEGRDKAIATATQLMALGLHKQIANRVLEPWFHINTLVTATEWDNFFELRCHPDAQPEMQTLANCIRSAMIESVPVMLEPGEWHLPYVDAAFLDTHTWALAQKISVARCARVSFLTQEGTVPTVESDLELYERLVGARPIHASPAEHQATPDSRYLSGTDDGVWRHAEQHRNFVGWRQYRAMID